MAVEAVVFDVGETLVDETAMWTRAAEAAGVTPFTLMAGLGATIALERPHDAVWTMLGIDPPAGSWVMDDWYPDARPCLERLRADGYRVCACGNTPAFVEQDLAPLVDAVASSESLGVWKPAPEFFERLVDLAGVPAERIAYVGDRVDNDVGPAIAAGMTGVHIRRGPWGYLQTPPDEAIRIESLVELPGAFS
ncbi:MAG TPA: HAD family hydrolase [Gaiellaceae bacterium]|nr:HAD family hydrolase [Gaiellaceae bacterium]